MTKCGWPDFICRRGAELMCVEVKDRTPLSFDQEETAVDLCAHGIPTYLWNAPHVGDAGRILEPISEVTHLLVDEELRATEAARHLRSELAIETARRERAEREAQRIRSRLTQVAAERRQEKTVQAHVTEDLGYLVRQVQDHQRQRGYTNRLKVIIRRYPDLAWPDLSEEREHA